MTDELVVLYFLAFAVLMGLVLYSVPGRVPLKVVVVASYFFVASSVYFSFESYKGWPTADEIGGRATVLWVEVAEGKTDEDSSVFLWLRVKGSKYEKQVDFAWFDPRTALAYRPQGYPRAYRIPYTKEAAEFADAAQRAIANGMEVEIDAEPGDGDGSSNGGAASTKKASGGGSSMSLGLDGIVGRILNPQAVLTK